MVVYEPDGNKVTLDLANGEEVVVEFQDEDEAILFFEAMKEESLAGK